MKAAHSTEPHGARLVIGVGYTRARWHLLTSASHPDRVRALCEPRLRWRPAGVWRRIPNEREMVRAYLGASQAGAPVPPLRHMMTTAALPVCRRCIARHIAWELAVFLPADSRTIVLAPRRFGAAQREPVRAS